MHYRQRVTSITSLVLLAVLLPTLILTACTTTEPEPAAQPTTQPTTQPTVQPTAQPTAQPAPTTAAPRTLKFSYTMPPDSSLGVGFEWWAREFEKRTDGRYKVETYPANSLIGLNAVLDSLREGVAEIALTSVSMFKNDFPATQVASLPSLVFPINSAEDYSKATEAFRQLAKMPEVAAEYSGFKLVVPFFLDPTIIVSKKTDIRVPEDFKGLKVGTSGYTGTIVDSFGGAVVHQVPPQAYMNMDKGVTDVAILNYAQISDYKLWEVADYFYDQGLTCGLMFLMMNQQAWNSMSPADQQIFTESWQEAEQICFEAQAEDRVASRQRIVEGAKFMIEPTPAEAALWREAGNIAFEQWKVNTKELGVENPEKVLEEWKKLMP